MSKLFAWSEQATWGIRSPCNVPCMGMRPIVRTFLKKCSIRPRPLPRNTFRNGSPRASSRQSRPRRPRDDLHFVSQLSEATKNADFMIEAVVEKLDVKRELFAELDKLCPPHAILASNSSNIVSSQFADVTSRPDKVCNMHFFNPALVMKVVEVVKGPHTSEETTQITMDLTKAIGKTPVLITKEIYGFVVNRILGALTREAFFLADEGYATPQDIDIAVEGALGHPMGPFRLLDLTGLDLSYTIRMERYKMSGDPKDKPPKILEEKYKAGEFGRKTGKGFYTY